MTLDELYMKRALQYKRRDLIFFDRNFIERSGRVFGDADERLARFFDLKRRVCRFNSRAMMLENRLLSIFLDRRLIGNLFESHGANSEKRG